jgi:Holliday junction resolvase RusA-like endonuclease
MPEQFFILSKIPLSPSINEALRPIKSTGRLVKTSAYQIWEKQMVVWKLKNFKQIDLIKAAFSDYKGALRVDLCFVLHKSRMVRKDGFLKEKRNDTNNFIKLNLDALSKILEIDDSRMNENFILRRHCVNESDQQTIIKISKCGIHEFLPRQDLSLIFALPKLD